MSNTSGIKPAEIPWILCEPDSSPLKTEESSDSTAMISIAVFLLFKKEPAPVIVPPVPTPATKASGACCPNASYISGPVVFSWTLGLDGFSN